MKKIITLLFLVAFGFVSMKAQIAAAGDYRSIASGSWGGASTWEVRDGAGVWTTTTTAPTSINNVYVQRGHTITADGAVACKNLQMNATGVLTIGANSVSVNGKLRAWTNSSTIATMTASGTLATLTTTTAHGFTTGQSVSMTNIAPNGATFNRVATITFVDATTFTYTIPTATVTTVAATAGTAALQAAVTGAADGPFYNQANSTSTTNANITTSGSGVLKFVGNTRNITSSGEWGTGTTTGSGINNCVVEFALTAGQTGTLSATLKALNIIVSSGNITAARFYLGTGVGTTGGSGGLGTGNLTIKNGATLLLSGGVNTTGNLTLSAGAFTRCGTVNIESGGTLELTSTTPIIEATTFTNNGTVTYSSNSAQTMVTRSGLDATAAVISAYKNLTLKGFNGKTLPVNTTVDSLSLTGSSNVLPVSNGLGTTLSYNTGGSLYFATTSGGQTLIGDTSRIWPATNGPTNVNYTGTQTFGFIASTSPAVSRTITGTFTLNNSSSFQVNTGNTLIMANGSTLSRLAATAFNPNGTVTFGSSASDNVSVIIGATCTSTSELPSGSAAQAINLTVNSGVTYTLAGVRSPKSVVLNGTLASAGFTLTTNLSGSGTFTGNYTHPTGKTLSPGNSPGTTTITGTLTNTGDWNIELGGATAGTQYDQILVTGAATLTSGTVTVTLINGYNPPGLTTFVILDAASLTGTLTINLPTLAGTKSWATPVYDNAAGTITLMVNATLPIELTNFQAKANQKSALLTWITASEKDNALFNIEQSTNGTDFQTIGEVKGQGTTAASTHYSFEHATPSVGVNYYRLKQVDMNGEATYSAVRTVVFGKSGLIVKPTLVQEAVNVVVSDDAATTISIFNISGQQVLTTKAQGEQRIDVSTLPTGLYMIRNTTGDVARFVKQ